MANNKYFQHPGVLETIEAVHVKIHEFLDITPYKAVKLVLDEIRKRS